MSAARRATNCSGVNSMATVPSRHGVSSCDATVRPEAQAVVGNGRAKMSYQASFVTCTLSSTFDAQSVEDLVVGAHALAAHGHARATKDPEVWAWGLHRACRTGPGTFGRWLGSGRHSMA